MEASVNPRPTRSLHGAGIDTPVKVPVICKEKAEVTKKRRKKKTMPSPGENWNEVIGSLVLPDLRMDSINGDMRPMEEKMKEADMMLHKRMMNLRHNVTDIVLRGDIDRSHDGHDRRYLYPDENKDSKNELVDDTRSPTFNVEERNKRRAKRLKHYPKLMSNQDQYPLSDLDAYRLSSKRSMSQSGVSFSDGDLETGTSYRRGNDSMEEFDSHDQQQDDNNNNNTDAGPMREKMRILGEQEHTLAEFDDEDHYKQRRTILFFTCLFFNTIGTVLMLFSLGVTSLFEDFGSNPPLFYASFVLFVPFLYWLRFTFLPNQKERETRFRMQCNEYDRRQQERKRYGYYHGHDPDEDAEDEGILWSADPRKKENVFTFLYQVLINYKELKISPTRVHTTSTGGGSINPNTSKGNTGSIRQSSVTMKQKSIGQQQSSAVTGSLLMTSTSAKQVK